MLTVKDIPVAGHTVQYHVGVLPNGVEVFVCVGHIVDPETGEIHYESTTNFTGVDRGVALEQTFAEYVDIVKAF